MSRLVFAFALLCTPLLAQRPAAGERPLTGLVLSGGGARGCAHVGVLKVLEELRIPVDFIAGTSMGSIVGGCYAYGYSPEQIEIELTRQGNRRPWADLLSDEPKRRQLAFRRKQEQRSYLGDIGIGIRDGKLKFPRGLLQGQNLELELRQLVPEAHDLATFDTLPIPFRAVAVDLADGAEVILDRGSLVDAMRASMSLPGIFAPVERDGALLIDGGIVNNVPMDVAKSMGATRLIVVDIGTPVTPAEISSALDVTVQMVSILTQQNITAMLKNLSDDDLLIQPDLGDLTSADFEKADQLIELGEKAARAAIPQLRRYSASKAEWSAFLERQRRPQRDIVINSIRVENSAGFDDRVISRRIRAKAGAPLNVAELREDLELLYGTGNYERLQYRLENGNGDRRDLTIAARDKSWGPTFLRFGIALESDLEGQSAFNLGGQINVRQIGAYSAEWRTDLQLGDESRVASEFFQPLGPASPFFVAPRIAASTFDVDTFQNGQRTAAFDVETGSLGLDAGVLLGTSGEIRVGYTRTAGSIDPSFSNQMTPGFNFDDATIGVSLGFDTLDHVNFPRWGTAGRVSWQWADESFGADSDYQRLLTNGAVAVSHERSTAILLARYETTLEDTTPLFAPSILGGFSNLSGLQRNELNGQHLGLLTLVLRQRLSGKHADTLSFPVYVGGTIEAGNVWQDRDDVWGDLRIAGSVYLAVDTPVGPTYVAYGLAEGGVGSVYLFVGQIF